MKKKIIVIAILLIVGSVWFKNISNIMFEKKMKDIEFPIAYFQIFDDEYKNKISNIRTIILEDSSCYPISHIKVEGLGEVIMTKFDTKTPLKNLIKIQQNQAKITKDYLYTPLITENIEFSLSRRISSSIDSIRINFSEPQDSLFYNQDVFYCNFKLDKFSFQLDERENVEIFGKNNFLKKHSNLSIFILKKFNSVYVLLLDNKFNKSDPFYFLNLNEFINYYSTIGKYSIMINENSKYAINKFSNGFIETFNTFKIDEGVSSHNYSFTTSKFNFDRDSSLIDKSSIVQYERDFLKDCNCEILTKKDTTINYLPSIIYTISINSDNERILGKSIHIFNLSYVFNINFSSFENKYHKNKGEFERILKSLEFD